MAKHQFKAREWNDEDSAELVKLYAEGATYNALRLRFGCSQDAIETQLKRRGIELRPKLPQGFQNKPWTGKEVKQARELWEDGVSITEMARILKRSPNGIKHCALSHKFPTRREHLAAGARQLNTLVSSYLYNKLKRLAKERGCSLGQVVRELLRDELMKPVPRIALNHQERREAKKNANLSALDDARH